MKELGDSGEKAVLKIALELLLFRGDEIASAFLAVDEFNEVSDERMELQQSRFNSSEMRVADFQLFVDRHRLLPQRGHLPVRCAVELPNAPFEILRLGLQVSQTGLVEEGVDV